MELDRSRREVNGCNETEIVSTVEKWRNRKTFNIYFFFGDRNRGRCALFTEILVDRAAECIGTLWFFDRPVFPL